MRDIENWIRAVGAGLGVWVIGHGAAAQGLVLELCGSEFAGGLGTSVAIVPDRNGDGHDELLVGSPGTQLGRGSVRLHSGADGALLWEVVGDPIGIGFGAAVDVVGDLDGDGAHEVIVGAFLGSVPHRFQAGWARVLSGADGSTRLQIDGDFAGDHLGWSVAGVGDLDGDGLGDFALGAVDGSEGALGSGRIQVHSGADGSELWRAGHTASFQFMGFSLAAAGDVNGDGIGDVLAGGPGLLGSGNPGRAALHSGLDGALLLEIAGTSGNDLLGTSVAGVGDVDGDGTPDLLLGAPQASTHPGYALLVSGSDGSTIRTLSGGADDRDFGARVEGLGDIDRDGLGDYAVASPTSREGGFDAGLVRVHLGFDGSELWRAVGGPGERLGVALAGGGDLGDDGEPDLALGRPGSSQAAPGAGCVEVRRGNDQPPPPPSGDPLTVDREHISLSAGEAQTLLLDAGRERAQLRYALIGSASGTDPGLAIRGQHLALNPDRYFWRSLLCPRSTPLRHARGHLDDDGRATASFLPRGRWVHPSLVGHTFHHAFVLRVRGQGLVFASNSVAVTIVP